MDPQRYKVLYTYEAMADWSHLVGNMPLPQQAMTTHHARAVVASTRPLTMDDAAEVAAQLSVSHDGATVTVEAIDLDTTPTDMPSPQQCEQIVTAALHRRDFKGVDAALRLLAIQDPHRAQELFDVIKAGLAIVRAADTQPGRTE